MHLDKHYLKINNAFWGTNPKQNNKLIHTYITANYKNASIININKLYKQVRTTAHYITKMTGQGGTAILITHKNKTIKHNSYILLKQKWVPGILSNFKQNPYALETQIKKIPTVIILINPFAQKHAINEAYKYTTPIFKTQNTFDNPLKVTYNIITHNNHKPLHYTLTQLYLKIAITAQLTTLYTKLLKTPFYKHIYLHQ